MQVHAINHETRFLGGLTFKRYLAALVCGPQATETFKFGMSRQGGVSQIPGIVDALLDLDICERGDVIAAAARASRCRPATVARFIDTLTGPNPSRHLWFEQKGELCVHEEVNSDDQPQFVIAE